MLIRFFPLGLLLMICGCTSVSEDEFKKENLYGGWVTSTKSMLWIYTDNYGLWIGNKPQNYIKDATPVQNMIPPPPPSKFKYEITYDKGIRVNNARLKKDSKSFYMDYAPYWIDFVPSGLEIVPYIINPSLDNVGVVRKISDKEVVDFLRQAGVTKEQVFNLPIKDFHNVKVVIPNASAPEIFDKLK